MSGQTYPLQKSILLILIALLFSSSFSQVIVLNSSSETEQSQTPAEQYSPSEQSDNQVLEQFDQQWEGNRYYQHFRELFGIFPLRDHYLNNEVNAQKIIRLEELRQNNLMIFKSYMQEKAPQVLAELQAESPLDSIPLSANTFRIMATLQRLGRPGYKTFMNREQGDEKNAQRNRMYSLMLLWRTLEEEQKLQFEVNIEIQDALIDDFYDILEDDIRTAENDMKMSQYDFSINPTPSKRDSNPDQEEADPQNNPNPEATTSEQLSLEQFDRIWQPNRYYENFRQLFGIFPLRDHYLHIEANGDKLNELQALRKLNLATFRGYMQQEQPQVLAALEAESPLDSIPLSANTFRIMSTIHRLGRPVYLSFLEAEEGPQKNAMRTAMYQMMILWRSLEAEQIMEFELSIDIQDALTDRFYDVLEDDIRTAENDIKMSQYDFSINPTPSKIRDNENHGDLQGSEKYTEVLKPENSFKWLYVTNPSDSQTTFTGVIYKEGYPGNKETITMTLDGLWEIMAGTDETHNCAILYNSGDRNISMFSFDEESGSVELVEELTNYFASALVSGLKNVEVADNCKAFRINDQIWRETGSEPKFAIDQSSSDWQDFELDETFEVAINGQKLYTYNGSEYTEALSSVFYDRNQIWLSEDKDRIIVLSSSETNEGMGYQFAVRYFVLKGSTWSEIDINIGDSSYMAVPHIEYSPDFLVIGVYYIDATGAVQMVIKHINQNEEVQIVQVPETLKRLNIFGQISNEYFYFRTLFQQNSAETYLETLYRIDKEANELTMVEMNEIAEQNAENFEKTLLIEDQQGLMVLTEIEDEGEITLRKSCLSPNDDVSCSDAEQHQGRILSFEYPMLRHFSQKPNQEYEEVEPESMSLRTFREKLYYVLGDEVGDRFFLTFEELNEEFDQLQIRKDAVDETIRAIIEQLQRLQEEVEMQMPNDDEVNRHQLQDLFAEAMQNLKEREILSLENLRNVRRIMQSEIGLVSQYDNITFEIVGNLEQIVITLEELYREQFSINRRFDTLLEKGLDFSVDLLSPIYYEFLVSDLGLLGQLSLIAAGSDCALQNSTLVMDLPETFNIGRIESTFEDLVQYLNDNDFDQDVLGRLVEIQGRGNGITFDAPLTQITDERWTEYLNSLGYDESEEDLQELTRKIRRMKAESVIAFRKYDRSEYVTICQNIVFFEREGDSLVEPATIFVV